MNAVPVVVTAVAVPAQGGVSRPKDVLDDERPTATAEASHRAADHLAEREDPQDSLLERSPLPRDR